MLGQGNARELIERGLLSDSFSSIKSIPYSLAACLVPRRTLFARDASPSPSGLCHPHSQITIIETEQKSSLFASLHQNMRSINSGTHPQRSLSPPPDLLSSMLQEEPPSPPPYKPSIFSPIKAKMMTTPPSSSPFDQQAPHVMVSRINARLSSNIDNGADSKGTFFNSSRLFAQDDETTTDDSWSISTNER